MSKLRIADSLALPLDAVTQAIGVVAKRRVGKSYTARRFTEQLLKAGQQVVIVDPKGDWWGIRSSADGKGPGYSVVIIGGEHGDVPLDKSNGEIVAKLVVEERVSVLLDLSQLRKREVAVFMADFLETLYRLKAKESLRTPVMLIIDEADAIAPQKPQEGEERMLGAAEDIVRRGGQRGIGCMMITQRTAVLNKNVLTQCEVLVALRTIAPQDLKAMQAWIDVHGEPEQRDTLMASLPSLPVGEAWFWSPGWPTAAGIFKRVQVLPIETFDSGATPKSGERRVEPKTVADVDLDALQRQMAETIAKAKADDPKALRAEIAALKKQLAAAPAKVDHATKVSQIDAAVNAARAQWTREMKRVLNKDLGALGGAIGKVKDLIGRVDAATNDTTAAFLALDASLSPNGEMTPTIPTTPQRPPVPTSRPRLPTTQRPRKAVDPGAKISGTAHRMVNALLFLETVGTSPASRQAIAGLMSVSWDTGSFRNVVSELRVGGYIVDAIGGAIALTEEGRAIANDEGLPTTRAELHAAWRAKLSGTTAKMFDILIDSYPEFVERATIAEMLNVDHNTGSFRNNLSEMRSPGLIVDDPTKTAVRAADALFPEGLD